MLSVRSENPRKPFDASFLILFYAAHHPIPIPSKEQRPQLLKASRNFLELLAIWKRSVLDGSTPREGYRCGV
jgi:hypothetical protein